MATRRKRRTRAELLEAQRQDLAARERDAMQEEAERINRAFDIMELWLAGYSWNEIAHKMGITYQQAQRICGTPIPSSCRYSPIGRWMSPGGLRTGTPMPSGKGAE
jgi:DNA invertase Pin-like site-specific DNA recombinase